MTGTSEPDGHNDLLRRGPPSVTRLNWTKRHRSIFVIVNSALQRLRERPLSVNVEGRCGSIRGGRACSTTANRCALGYTKDNGLLGDSAIAIRLIALALFFAYASLREDPSALSADTRGSQSRMGTGICAHGQQEAVSDLPRSEHRSAAMQRAASTRMQLFDSRGAAALNVE